MAVAAWVSKRRLQLGGMIAAGVVGVPGVVLDVLLQSCQAALTGSADPSNSKELQEHANGTWHEL